MLMFSTLWISEAHLLEGLAHVAERDRRVGARKYVLAHEEAPDEILGAQTDHRDTEVAPATETDPLEQEDPVVLEQVVDELAVLREVLDADVLDHLEARDAVVLLARDVAVIEALDSRALREARLRDAIVAEGRLVLADRDAGRPGAEGLRRVHREGAPAAADVEHLVARAQHQLAAHQVHLVVLRLLERLVLVVEDRARVDHPIAEERREEVVASIVVLAHDPLVLRLGVDGHLRDHSREEELEMLLGQVEVDQITARFEERVHVGDVHGAIEVSLEERGHGDLARGVASGELLVVEDDEIGQLGHGCLESRSPPGRQSEAERDHNAPPCSTSLRAQA